MAKKKKKRKVTIKRFGYSLRGLRKGQQAAFGAGYTVVMNKKRGP